MNTEKTSLENERKPSYLGAVMPCYFYQDGSEVKENDIVFYSEDGGDHKYHSASRLLTDNLN